MGFFDGFLDSIGLDDVIRGVTGLASAYNTSSMNDNIYDAARAAERQSREDYDVNRQAYLEYLNQVQGIQGQNSAARAAAARAAAAQRGAYNSAMTKAKLQEEKNKQAAAKKGLDSLEGSLMQAYGLMNPFLSAATEMLPLRNKIYGSGGNNILMANDWLKNNKSRMASAMLPSEMPINNRFNVTVGK